VPILVTAFQRKLLIQNAARHCAYKYKHGSRGLNYWVKHTNKTVLGDYTGLALKRSTVQLWMGSGKLDPFTCDQTTKCNKNGRMKNYLYSQMMKSSRHSLRMNVKPKKKRRAHLPATDLPHIMKQISILPDSRMMYSIRDLHQVPHGNAPISEKPKAEEKLRRSGIQSSTIMHGGSDGVVDLSESSGIVVYYGNSRHIGKIPNVEVGEDAILQHALNKNNSTVVDKTRGRCSDKKSINRRVRWGVGQNQPTTNQKYRCYNLSNGEVTEGPVDQVEIEDEAFVSIPTINTDSFDAMPVPAKELVRNVSKAATQMMRHHYGCSGYHNKRRNRYFSGHLNRKMGMSYANSGFEYYDIQIMSTDVMLNRHMDYKNDSRESYNHTCVYAFYRVIKGREYRVSIVMTSRRNAGAFMAHTNG
jgi:hypothetical protein